MNNTNTCLETIKGTPIPRETHSFASLYTHFYPILLRYGMQVVRDKELISDTIQELFQHLWEKRFNDSSIRSMSNYLKISLRRRLIYSINKLRRFEVMDHDYFSEHCEFLQEHAHEQEVITTEEQSQKRGDIDTFLESLSPRRREVVELRYLQGYSHQEISSHLGIKYQTVLNHFQAAFKQN